jgi:hypothetical protein
VGVPLAHRFCVAYGNRVDIRPMACIPRVSGMVFARNGKRDVTAPFTGGSLHARRRSAHTCLGRDGIRTTKGGVSPLSTSVDAAHCMYMHRHPAGFREIS